MLGDYRVSDRTSRFGGLVGYRYIAIPGGLGGFCSDDNLRLRNGEMGLSNSARTTLSALPRHFR